MNETIQILVDKGFINDWFTKKNDLNIERKQHVKLLELDTSKQLCDGVARGTAFWPLVTRNTFMC